MTVTDVSQELPYATKRILSRYEPAFRARLTRFLKARLSEPGYVITWADINAAISQTFAELTHSKHPRFSPTIEKLAMEQYNRQEFKTTEEWINELAGRMANRDSGKV